MWLPYDIHDRALAGLSAYVEETGEHIRLA